MENEGTGNGIAATQLLQKLTQKGDLSGEESALLMEGIMAGKFTNAQTAGLLVALKMKGETEGEITAFAKVMRRNAERIQPKCGTLVDTCGTGGDYSGTFNISTAAAFIAAGAGIKIAKHGNRAMSGKSGSADVLEALGARMLQGREVEKCIEETGFGFMFAPFFHPAMKNVAIVRKELGIRTVFNLLGPLSNPAGAEAQVLGVFSPLMCTQFANILKSLGTKRALVVNSEGMDEIGLGITRVCELKDGETIEYELNAAEFGFTARAIPKCESKEESAQIILDILNGMEGPALDVSLMNAATAIYVGGGAESIKEGLENARKSVHSGQAKRKLDEFVEFTQASARKGQQ